MMFDFEGFTVRAKLAYRRNKSSAYSLEEVLQVFRYYFDTYEYLMESAHPMISIDQITRIIEKMPLLQDDGETSSGLDISPEAYEAMIDQHFVTKYARCDYNINHFFAGTIRNLRYYETCY